MKNSSFSPANDQVKSAVPAVAKVVRLLDEVAGTTDPVGISELARRTGMSKSTVHGLVNALSEEGILAALTGNRAYVLGSRLIELGTRARDQHLLEEAEIVLRRLSSESGESVFFGRLDGERVVILARSASLGPLSLSAPVGSTVPVGAGALGKAHLSLMRPSDARAYLKIHAPHRYTEYSVVDMRAYLAATDAVRASGYAVERSEYLEGVAAAAAAFESRGGTYFIWAVGIDANSTDEQLAHLGEMVGSAVTAIQKMVKGNDKQPPRGGS